MTIEVIILLLTFMLYIFSINLNYYYSAHTTPKFILQSHVTFSRNRPYIIRYTKPPLLIISESIYEQDTG